MSGMGRRYPLYFPKGSVRAMSSIELVARQNTLVCGKSLWHSALKVLQTLQGFTRISIQSFRTICDTLLLFFLIFTGHS